MERWILVLIIGCATAAPPAAVAVKPPVAVPAPAPRPPKQLAPQPELEAKCGLGDAWSCVPAGLRYMEGYDGVAVDWLKARALLQQACDGDIPEGCGLLRNLYSAGGHGIDRDLDRAQALQQKICDLGYCHPDPDAPEPAP